MNKDKEKDAQNIVYGTKSETMLVPQVGGSPMTVFTKLQRKHKTKLANVRTSTSCKDCRTLICACVSMYDGETDVFGKSKQYMDMLVPTTSDRESVQQICDNHFLQTSGVNSGEESIINSNATNFIRTQTVDVTSTSSLLSNATNFIRTHTADVTNLTSISSSVSGILGNTSPINTISTTCTTTGSGLGLVSSTKIPSESKHLVGPSTDISDIPDIPESCFSCMCCGRVEAAENLQSFSINAPRQYVDDRHLDICDTETNISYNKSPDSHGCQCEEMSAVCSDDKGVKSDLFQSEKYLDIEIVHKKNNLYKESTTQDMVTDLHNETNVPKNKSYPKTIQSTQTCKDPKLNEQICKDPEQNEYIEVCNTLNNIDNSESSKLTNPLNKCDDLQSDNYIHVALNADNATIITEKEDNSAILNLDNGVDKCENEQPDTDKTVNADSTSIKIEVNDNCVRIATKNMDSETSHFTYNTDTSLVENSGIFKTDRIEIVKSESDDVALKGISEDVRTSASIVNESDITDTVKNEVKSTIRCVNDNIQNSEIVKDVTNENKIAEEMKPVSTKRVFPITKMKTRSKSKIERKVYPIRRRGSISDIAQCDTTNKRKKSERHFEKSNHKKKPKLEQRQSSLNQSESCMDIIKNTENSPVDIDKNTICNMDASLTGINSDNSVLKDKNTGNNTDSSLNNSENLKSNCLPKDEISNENTNVISSEIPSKEIIKDEPKYELVIELDEVDGHMKTVERRIEEIIEPEPMPMNVEESEDIFESKKKSKNKKKREVTKPKENKESADKKKKPPKEPKCRICDKIFKTLILLQRHNKVPCKIKNTRNWCQKVLRPKRRSCVTNNIPEQRVSSGKNSKNVKFNLPIARPHLLPVRRISDASVEIPKVKKVNKKRRKSAPPIIYIPYVKEYNNRHINVRVKYETLSNRDKYFFDLGMIPSVSLMPQCLESNHISDIQNIAIKSENERDNMPVSSCPQVRRSLTPPPQLEKIIYIKIDEDENAEGNFDELSPPVLEAISRHSPKKVSPKLKATIYSPQFKKTSIKRPRSKPVSPKPHQPSFSPPVLSPKKDLSQNMIKTYSPLKSELNVDNFCSRSKQIQNNQPFVMLQDIRKSPVRFQKLSPKKTPPSNMHGKKDFKYHQHFTEIKKEVKIEQCPDALKLEANSTDKSSQLEISIACSEEIKFEPIFSIFQKQITNDTFVTELQGNSEDVLSKDETEPTEFSTPQQFTESKNSAVDIWPGKTSPTLRHFTDLLSGVSVNNPKATPTKNNHSNSSGMTNEQTDHSILTSPTSNNLLSPCSESRTSARKHSPSVTNSPHSAKSNSSTKCQFDWNTPVLDKISLSQISPKMSPQNAQKMSPNASSHISPAKSERHFMDAIFDAVPSSTEKSPSKHSDILGLNVPQSASCASSSIAKPVTVSKMESPIKSATRNLFDSFSSLSSPTRKQSDKNVYVPLTLNQNEPECTHCSDQTIKEIMVYPPSNININTIPEYFSRTETVEIKQNNLSTSDLGARTDLLTMLASSLDILPDSEESFDHKTDGVITSTHVNLPQAEDEKEIEVLVMKNNDEDKKCLSDISVVTIPSKPHVNKFLSSVVEKKAPKPTTVNKSVKRQAVSSKQNVTYSVPLPQQTETGDTIPSLVNFQEGLIYGTVQKLDEEYPLPSYDEGTQMDEDLLADAIFEEMKQECLEKQSSKTLNYYTNIEDREQVKTVNVQYRGDVTNFTKLNGHTSNSTKLKLNPSSSVVNESTFANKGYKSDAKKSKVKVVMCSTDSLRKMDEDNTYIVVPKTDKSRAEKIDQFLKDNVGHSKPGHSNRVFNQSSSSENNKIRTHKKHTNHKVSKKKNSYGSFKDASTVVLQEKSRDFNTTQSQLTAETNHFGKDDIGYVDNIQNATIPTSPKLENDTLNESNASNKSEGNTPYYPYDFEALEENSPALETKSTTNNKFNFDKDTLASANTSNTSKKIESTSSSTVQTKPMSESNILTVDVKTSSSDHLESLYDPYDFDDSSDSNSGYVEPDLAPSTPILL